MNLFNKGKNSRKIIISLFVIVVILLLANFTLEILWSNKVPRREFKKQIDIKGIERIFNESLVDLGIEKNWINLKKKRKVSSAVSKNNYVLYSVAIPADLPITVVLNEIFISFKNYDVNLKSEEQKINGRTLLKISSGNNLKLAGEFFYDKSISRDAGSIGIFITGITDLTGEKAKTLLSIPETFELLLVPSKESSGILKTLKEYKKGYGILLNDDITDLEFKLNSKYSSGRLKSSVRNILGKFPGSSVFIIDNNSNLFSSDVYPLLKKEFTKRKFRLVSEDSLSELTNEVNNNALKDFRNQIEQTKRGEKAEFVVTAEEFRLLQPEIVKFRKVGYKFMHPSELLKK
jgi:hypothetical protein